ncbi:MAG: SPASM domain-containing protein [Lachnospiraceae bacterium]|nr:SPASM domain-containing protein [Lachnospiraceae bacterium]
MKQYIIFGAGDYGKIAFHHYGYDAVACFMDNNPAKIGTELFGKKIIAATEAAEFKDDYCFVVASIYSSSMIKQLQENGITDYIVFTGKLHGYYDSGELIVNPYDALPDAGSEKEWIDSEKLKYARQAVNDEAEELYGKEQLFNHIEIETINRCNGVCDFCPVNKNADPREKAVMPEELFCHIVDELEALNYAGRFTTFSNNEPLLDERIVRFNQYARKHLPNARMHLYTNGTLLTLETFLALVEVLDELIIDNYQQELKLIKPCRIIAEYCEEHPKLKEKVTIVLRKPHEILTSRGGTAPNRKELPSYGKDRCILPYKQMIVRPTGQVSLCCNDAIGKYTLGDLSKESITDVWYGPRFRMVRECLYKGRENWGNCQYCDTFSVG